MRNFIIKVQALLFVLVLTACTSSTPSGQKSSTPTQPEIHYNALSGREGPDGPVLVVKIDDTYPAHPQIGLEKADVVYIEQVEAGLTRLAAVFSSELPDRIGPVRSARISDIDIFAQYGRVAFAYSGAQSKMRPIISAANWIDLGAEREPASIYTRDRTRNAPVNMVLLPQALLDRAAGRGNVPVNAASVGWTFGKMPQGGVPVSKVNVDWPASKYEITWNGSAFVLRQDRHAEESEAGIPYSPSTIAIQLVSIRPSEFKDRHGGITPKSEVVGSGTALILRNGRAFQAKWSRPTATAPTIWTQLDGTPMPFAPGQIWVMLADQTRPPLVTAVETSTPTPSK